MKKKIIIFSSAVLAILLIFSGVSIYWFITSPEYTLAAALKELKDNGYDAFRVYLTEETDEKLEKIRTITDNKIIGTILSLANKENYMKQLLDKASIIDWKITDVINNHHKAQVTLHFAYEDNLSGEIDIEMLRENSRWRISEVSLPRFEKLSW